MAYSALQFSLSRNLTLVHASEFNWLYVRKIKIEQMSRRLASVGKVECGSSFSADASRQYIWSNLF